MSNRECKNQFAIKYLFAFPPRNLHTTAFYGCFCLIDFHIKLQSRDRIEKKNCKMALKRENEIF